MQSKCEMSITSDMIEGQDDVGHEEPSETKVQVAVDVLGCGITHPYKFHIHSKLKSATSRRYEFIRELGNKCGKCQNHDIEVSKKGHAKDCPFKRCDCLRCRLLDARSDILQVISGKETKLKGTKKDPNCGFCQNHSIKILRKGHVRSCGFGQERHFKLDNCFDCEVHYIRNEVNRLQIKMRRAMKEDRTLSEEQRKTAREAITRDEVEKVCDLARLARKKREAILAQQAGECSAAQTILLQQTGSQRSDSLVPSPASSVESPVVSGRPSGLKVGGTPQPPAVPTLPAGAGCFTGPTANQESVWRPWSQHQVAAAIAVAQQQQQQQQHHHHQQQHHLHLQQHTHVAQPPHHQQLQHQLPVHLNSVRQQHLLPIAPHHPQIKPPQPQQLQLQQQRFFHQRNHQPPSQPQTHTYLAQTTGHHHNQQVGPALAGRRLVPQRPVPYAPQRQLSPTVAPTDDSHQPQPLPLSQRNLQDQQQIFNTIQLFRLIAQVVQSSTVANPATEA